MPPTPGLNVVNTSGGDGIIGGTTDRHGIGVHGVINSTGSPSVVNPEAAAVLGEAGDFPVTGVIGYSQRGAGVYGQGSASGVVGVSTLYGVGSTPPVIAGVLGVGPIGVFGFPTAQPNGFAPAPGVLGQSDQQDGVGVEGDADFGVGVEGNSEFGVGVWGISRTGAGVRASADTGDRGGWALLTDGDALIQGGLYVAPGFPKSALVRLRDGSHRALYCVESPECWFEDFGRARLVRGRARVRVDATFAAVIRTGDYHVFLSPEGLSHGLYVSRRTRDGFEVREQHRGTSTVSFSYRIVGRRKDVAVPRFKRVNLRALAKLPRRFERRRRQIGAAAKPPRHLVRLRPSQLETLLRPAQGRTRSGTPLRRRGPRR